MDILDQTSRDAKVNDGYRYGLVAIDVWSRRVAGVPMRTKTPNEVIRAINEASNQIGGVPKLLATDVGGEFSGPLIAISRRRACCIYGGIPGM